MMVIGIKCPKCGNEEYFSTLAYTNQGVPPNEKSDKNILAVVKCENKACGEEFQITAKVAHESNQERG